MDPTGTSEIDALRMSNPITSPPGALSLRANSREAAKVVDIPSGRVITTSNDENVMM